jgi:hypothetical protein
MILCDVVRAVVLAGLAVAVALHEIVWPVVLAVAIIDRVGDTLFTPASVAALPGIVASHQLEDAWAATEARQYAASLGGPALGGILYSLGQAVPFIGDTVSYGISAVTSVRIKGDFAPKRSTERKGLWKEALEGIHVIWHDSLLRAVVLQAPLINFAFAGMLFTVTLALRHHGTSATVIGLTNSAIMVGGFLGAIAAPRLQGRLSLSRMVAVVTAGGAVLFGVASILVPSPLLAIPLALALFLSPAANAALFASMLRRTPAEMRGRVNNTLLQFATGLAALAPITSGLLVQHTTSNIAMGAFAVALAVAAIVSLSLKGLREAEAERGL